MVFPFYMRSLKALICLSVFNAYACVFWQVSKSFHHCLPGQPCTHGVTVASLNHRVYDSDGPFSGDSIYHQGVLLAPIFSFSSVRVCVSADILTICCVCSHDSAHDHNETCVCCAVQIGVNQTVPRTWYALRVCARRRIVSLTRAQAPDSYAQHMPTMRPSLLRQAFRGGQLRGEC